MTSVLMRSRKLMTKRNRQSFGQQPCDDIDTLTRRKADEYLRDIFRRHYDESITFRSPANIIVLVDQRPMETVPE